MADNDQALQAAENEFTAAHQRKAQTELDIQQLERQLAQKRGELFTQTQERLAKLARVSGGSLQAIQ